MIDIDDNGTLILNLTFFLFSLKHASYPRPQLKSLEACSLEQAFQ